MDGWLRTPIRTLRDVGEPAVGADLARPSPFDALNRVASEVIDTPRRSPEPARGLPQARAFQPKARIRRMPPNRVLKGADLGPYDFRVGGVDEREPHVANLLILWDGTALAPGRDTFT